MYKQFSVSHISQGGFTFRESLWAFLCVLVAAWFADASENNKFLVIDSSLTYCLVVYLEVWCNCRER